SLVLKFDTTTHGLLLPDKVIPQSNNIMVQRKTLWD
ncbi:hypothetical protein SNEBB_009347, partial [Seison nebaliae]